jgi:purine-binding chemotaxis protein CheW
MEDNTDNIYQSVLSFTVGKEYFAAEVEKVLSILDMVNITQVPKSPDYLLGVINHRGNVLPVIDSRIRFGIIPTPVSRDSCIIVMEVLLGKEELNVGVLVDAVHEVIEIDTQELQSPPGLGNKYKAEFIKGIFVHSAYFIMLLDVDKLLSSDELLFVKEATEEPLADSEDERINHPLNKD